MSTAAYQKAEDTDMPMHSTPAVSGRAIHQAPPAAGPSPREEALGTPIDGSALVSQPQASVAARPAHRYRKWLLWAGIAAGLVVSGRLLVPWMNTTLNTISTD